MTTRGKVTAAAVLTALTLAACGSSSAAVPDVVGERLDVAESEVKDAGLGEEVGGGTFGIMVKSNWIVCQTDPAAEARPTRT